jgi:hypothetical protein
VYETNRRGGEENPVDERNTTVNVEQLGVFVHRMCGRRHAFSSTTLAVDDRSLFFVRLLRQPLLALRFSRIFGQFCPCPLSALAGRHDDGDVICLSRRTVNNPFLPKGRIPQATTALTLSATSDAIAEEFFLAALLRSTGQRPFYL